MSQLNHTFSDRRIIIITNTRKISHADSNNPKLVIIFPLIWLEFGTYLKIGFIQRVINILSLLKSLSIMFYFDQNYCSHTISWLFLSKIFNCAISFIFVSLLCFPVMVHLPCPIAGKGSMWENSKRPETRLCGPLPDTPPSRDAGQSIN